MEKIYKQFFIVLSVMALTIAVQAQNIFFTDINESAINSGNAKRVIVPQKFRSVSLSNPGFKKFLWSLPQEENVSNRTMATILELPMPDGSMAKFHVWESSLMAPELEAKFPEMKTFAGQGITDPYASIRFDYNPYFGFSAQILSAVSGRIFIDAYARGDINNYISYYSRDFNKMQSFDCAVPSNPGGTSIIAAGPCRGTQLYTYRLALACTGEYAVAVAGANPTVPAVAAAMLTAVNRVVGVYETEASIRMILVPDNDNLIFLNGATDPYTNNNGGTMLGQNITTCNNIIGIGNYDIGHVFSTGGGGVAFLGCICTANKGGGVTGLPNPVGDAFYIDYVAHEMGHQYAGNHTFNSTTGSCSGNRNAGTAYEPGSGTTIQGYAGICGADNTQPNSDPFFHTVSFDEISNYAAGNGGTCAVITPTGNTLPVITAMNNNGANIPLNTPFTLTGAATDADNDPITYCWEEWDLGTSGAWNNGANSTTAPLFKSRIPKINGARTFPDMAVILAGYPANPPSAMNGFKGETLPLVARAIKFRLTIRDNRAGGGGVVTGGDGCQAGFTNIFQVNTIAGTGPFIVTVPNGGETFSGGTAETITWNPAGSENAPINAANVKISLSTDGGLTYPTVITPSTPNDGSELLTIPTVATTTARIKIEGAGNIFFDISNANFTITANAVGFDFSNPAAATIACAAATSASVTLGSVSNGGYSTPIILSATGNPVGTTVGFSVNPLVPGNNTVVTLNNTNTLSAGTYNIVITGISGTITQTRTLSFIISAGAGPGITTQPANQGACMGSPATFSVTAPTATGYQWQISTNGGGTFTSITGATGATFTIASVTAAQHNYQYRCILNGQCNTTTSTAGILTINLPPTITQQPVNTAVCAGNTTSFTVAVSGAGPAYQWQLSTDGGVTFNNIAGANAATYSFVSALTQNGYRYRSIVTGSCAPVVTSTAAILTVGSTLIVNSQPAGSIICAGGNSSFNVTVTGTVTYQWQESTDAGATYSNITNGGIYAGATTATLSLTGVPATASNNLYRCIISGNCPSVNSLAASLTVNTAPAITAQPAATSIICAAQNTSFSVTATGTATTYQWQVSTDGGITYNNLANGGVYSNVTTTTLNISGAIVTMNSNRYRCIISGTCAPAATTTASLLTVYTPVSINSNPANALICENSNASFTVSVTGTSPAYQWQVSSNGGATYTNVTNAGVYSGATSATLTLAGVSFGLNGNIYRCIISGTAPCGAINSATGILNVNVAPSKFTVTGGGAYCVGANGVPVGLSSSVPGIRYQLLLNNINNGVTVSGTGTAFSFGNKTLPGTYTVLATNAATGCTQQMTGSVTVVVNPLPTIALNVAPYKNLFPGLVTILTATATTTAIPATINYAWFKNNSSINNNTNTLPVSINNPVTNLGDYRVTITDANGCINQSQVITIADSANSRLFIYPNPNDGQFTIAYHNPGSINSKQVITIYSSKGEQVYNKEFPVTVAYQLLSIYLRRNGAGIYIVMLTDGNGKKIKTAEVLIR